jgi:hypothetical protein
MPAAGWPVAIFGHGQNNNTNATSLTIASSLAAQGIATIAINHVGHGFGPLGTLTVHQTTGDAVTVPAGGRGQDLDGDHEIGASEGSGGDGVRQVSADLMQLVRVIEVGMNVDGNGSPDLDPSRIYYVGQSAGGNYGTLFAAIEPDVRDAVLASTGGVSHLTPSLRNGASLADRVPPLINSPGIVAIDGVAVPPPYYNENSPLRNGVPLHVLLADGTTHVIQSPVMNTVAGAIAIQEVRANQEWISRLRDPTAYAPHLRKEPLPGIPAKSVIILYGKGDQTVPNPAETAVVRAGDLADRTTYYRHDLAFAADPTIGKNPHAILTAIGFPNPLVMAIARGEQQEVAAFFASDGTQIIHPKPEQFFEVPIQGPLPEGLNFIP